MRCFVGQQGCSRWREAGVTEPPRLARSRAPDPAGGSD